MTYGFNDAMEKVEVYSKEEVYNKNEVFTKAEAYPAADIVCIEKTYTYPSTLRANHTVQCNISQSDWNNAGVETLDDWDIIGIYQKTGANPAIDENNWNNNFFHTDVNKLFPCPFFYLVGETTNRLMNLYVHNPYYQSSGSESFTISCRVVLMRHRS
jgi:hypothetical protein